MPEENTQNTTQPVKKILPLVPLRNLVLFFCRTSIFVGRKSSKFIYMLTTTPTN